ncbi:MAG: LytTR family DNA-binding domain-containing protein [Pseudomonadota bacterium]
MQPLSFAKREMQRQNGLRDVTDIKDRGRDLLVFAAIGAFLAFINPYDATGDLIYPVAWLYWTAMILVGGLSALAGIWIYQTILQPGPDWGVLIVGSICSALGVSVFIIGIEFIFNDGLAMRYWLSVYGLVLVISIAITLVTFTVDRAFGPEAEAKPSDANPTETFMARLPVKYRTATLHAISSEDHYLRVHTSLGEELILMRLADAERELSGADGLRVHRSWWIAKDGITDERKDSGRSFLILPSGTEVPVSRSYRPKAKEAGYIS